MGKTFLNRSPKARSALALALAAAMLLPIPARCSSCSADANCSLCLATEPEAPNSRGLCCQRNLPSDDSSVVQLELQSIAPHTGACVCDLHRQTRTIPPSDKLSLSSQRFANLPSPGALWADLSAHDLTAALSFPANSPPPIPHRILHCSWLI
jgi:hypothetical protein